MPSKRYELTLPTRLKERIEAQTELTGERISEYIRRCVLEKLEVQEAKQAEIRLVENAVQNGLSA